MIIPELSCPATTRFVLRYAFRTVLASLLSAINALFNSENTKCNQLIWDSMLSHCLLLPEITQQAIYTPGAYPRWLFLAYIMYFSLNCKNILMYSYLSLPFAICLYWCIILWYMNEKQKNNLAKFFYDIAKIDFAALVVAQWANPSHLKYWILIVGIVATIVPLLVGIIMDKEENKKWQVLELSIS